MIAEAAQIKPSAEHEFDALSREVFGILGLPIDAVEVGEVVELVQASINNRRPFLVSTPNLNFLIRSLGDHLFRHSLLVSDLCPADGMPIVWLSRLLGVRSISRVSGADIFDALKFDRCRPPSRSIFLFGGPGDTCAKVSRAINSRPGGLRCVGSLNPGFGSVEELSDSTVLAAINASGADILAVFLSAEKAQAWLVRNHHYLRPCVRAQLGATINFQAGTVRRAPRFIRETGFEWLWRIKEEPYLWRRYLRDGVALLRIIVTRVVPFWVNAMWLALRKNEDQDLRIQILDRPDAAIVSLSGRAIREHVNSAIAGFRQALDLQRPLVIDLARTRYVDARFFGLLLQVRKQLEQRGQSLRFVNASSPIARAFRLNGFGFLIDQSSGPKWRSRLQVDLH